MTKKIRVSKDPSSVLTSYFPIGEEARARFKYCCLLQDYQELLKETKEKRERLEKMLQKKSHLLVEVKFLRQKFQQLSTTQTAQMNLKKQSHRLPTPSACIIQPHNPLLQTELPLNTRNQKLKQILIPTSPALLDLNQVFLPAGEEMERFNVEERLLNASRLSRFSREGGANDSMFSICRDRRIGSNRAGKRKVSWQDQLTLRV